VQNDPVEQFDLRWRVWGSELGSEVTKASLRDLCDGDFAAVSSIYCSRVTVFRRSDPLPGMWCVWNCLCTNPRIRNSRTANVHHTSGTWMPCCSLVTTSEICLGAMLDVRYDDGHSKDYSKKKSSPTSPTHPTIRAAKAALEGIRHDASSHGK
jgi:hypothetical protein